MSVPCADQTLAFCVEGAPVPWQRTSQSKSRRLDGRGVRRFTPKKTRDYQGRVALEAMRAIALWRRAHKATWCADLTFELRCTFFVPNLLRRDTSNLVKSVEDALNRVAWDDDSQVWRIVAEKQLDRERPRAEIIVRPLELNEDGNPKSKLKGPVKVRTA